MFRRAATGRTLNKVREIAREGTLGELQSSFGRFFGGSLKSALPAEKIKRRKRLFHREVTFWAFLSQVLTPGSACREAVRRVQLWWQLSDSPKTLSEDCSAYCQARTRLSLEWLESLNEALTSRLQREMSVDQLWCGRRVRVADGSASSMPDTPANQQRWPQPRNQKPGCGFPVMRMVGLFCLGTGAWIKTVHGTLKQAEARLVRELWPALGKGDVFLADRAFCSFVAMAHLLSKQVDCVFRLSKSRKIDLRGARKLAANDWEVKWVRPKRSAMEMEEDRTHYEHFPAELKVRVIRVRIEVRGFRTREIWLATTLLDAEKYPAKKLQELYLRRWGVELHFREIKTFLGMDVLRCKSPQMIEREERLHQIAYNLVRCVMQEAAATHAVSLSRLSFKGTLDTMRSWANGIHAVRHCPKEQKQLYATMLAIIARDTVPERPYRSEPRAKKRRPKPYRLLTQQRGKMVIHPRPRRR